MTDTVDAPPHDSLGRHLFLRELGPLKHGEQGKKAKAYKINPGTFSQLIHGQVEAGLDTAVKIEKKTKGRVPASAWRVKAPKPGSANYCGAAIKQAS
jgi:hypothetical protein